MKKHFVTFYIPGTLVAEETTKELLAWDVDQAVTMAQNVTERYGSKPFCFQFTTRERGPDDFDSQETARSPRYFLGGTAVTLEDVKARNDPNDEILVWNMEVNGWDKVIEGSSPWRWSQPLCPGDVLLERPTDEPATLD